MQTMINDEVKLEVERCRLHLVIYDMMSVTVEALEADLFEQSVRRREGDRAGQVKGLKHRLTDLFM